MVCFNKRMLEQLRAEQSIIAENSETTEKTVPEGENEEYADISVPMHDELTFLRKHLPEIIIRCKMHF